MNINGVLIVGPPGSGKSTIGKMLASKLGYKYISSGDIARRIAKTDKWTATSLEIGGMADEDKMREEIYRVIYRTNVNNEIFILDGFPRAVDQLLWLRRASPSLLTYVIDVPHNECADRILMRGRGDDELDIFEKRLRWYKQNTEMMIKHIGLVRFVGNDDINIATDIIIKDIEEKVR